MLLKILSQIGNVAFSLISPLPENHDSIIYRIKPKADDNRFIHSFASFISPQITREHTYLIPFLLSLTNEIKRIRDLCRLHDDDSLLACMLRLYVVHTSLFCSLHFSL
jgi:hypothetical protein